jgi:hypothetical protein
MHKASTVLTRATMAIDHPIFDPNANRKNRNVFLAHIFIIETAKLRVLHALGFLNTSIPTSGGASSFMASDSRKELLDPGNQLLILFDF